MTAAVRARGRTVRAAVGKSIRNARAAGRLQPWHEPAAAVAEKVAKAMDVDELPVADLTRLSTELQKLLAGLPLAPETAPKGADDDGVGSAAGGPGEGDPRAVGLASGVGSGPTVGDTALPA